MLGMIQDEVIPRKTRALMPVCAWLRPVPSLSKLIKARPPNHPKRARIETDLTRSVRSNII